MILRVFESSRTSPDLAGVDHTAKANWMSIRAAVAAFVSLFAFVPAPSYAFQDIPEAETVYVTAPMPNAYGCQYCWVSAGYGNGGASGSSGSGGGNYSQTCQSIRGYRPENCDDSDPGNPGDFPNSESSTLVLNPIMGVSPHLQLAFDRLYGCIGGGYNSVQGCADEIYRETYPTCTYQLCFQFSSDLVSVMGTKYIDDYVRDSVSWSIAWPAQIGITPDFDMFPEWVKELVTRSRAQMDCHNWHDRMQAAGCTP